MKKCSNLIKIADCHAYHSILKPCIKLIPPPHFVVIDYQEPVLDGLD